MSARKKNGAAGKSIVCFAASIPCQSRHLTVRRMRTVSKSATFLATESVNSAPIKRGLETEVQIFWQGKAQTSSPIRRCTFLARRSAKLIANFSATMVTSLPSFSLCISLSLSLSPNVPHAEKSIVEHKSSPGEADMGFDDLCSTIDFSSIF